MSCTKHLRTAKTLLGLVLLWAMAAACTQQSPATHSKADVLAIQAERFEAVVNADIETLDAILAQDLVYTHSTGRVESKADFMQSIASGSVDYIVLTPKNSQVRIYDEVAVVNGDVDLHVAAGGQEHHVSMRFTEVYVHSDEQWQLVAWQSTQIQ